MRGRYERARRTMCWRFGLTGQQGEAGGDARVDLSGRRRADGDGGADGDEADAVLLREPARLLFQEHLGDRVTLP
jgi:hypothetical protein